MLDVDELASMQQDAYASLPDVAAVWRGGSGTDDLQGGGLDKPIFVASYACRVMPLVKRAPLEVMSAGIVKQSASGAVQTVTRYSLMMPYNADVRPADLLLVGFMTYKVMDSGNPTECILRDVQCEVIT